MAGYDLKFGMYKEADLTEEDFWKSFNMVFSTKSVNISSYKFVFLKSILNCIKQDEVKTKYTFYEIYEQFVEIYWILVVKYKLCQSLSRTKITYIEQILHEYVDYNADEEIAEVKFCDLSYYAKRQMIIKAAEKCKKYVVGALYEDMQELFYSFSVKEGWIKINPKMLFFLEKHSNSIEELNYFELAKFLDKVNSSEAVEYIIAKNAYRKDISSLNIYRQMLYDEFERNTIIRKEECEFNTVEILMKAEETLHLAEKMEAEDSYLKSLPETGQTIENDFQSMIRYLDDPERIIKMLKTRKGIH